MKSPVRMIMVRVLAALGLALLFSGVAHAQATRTWVSAVGDDTNPCSRTAPCLTLAYALTQTASGGEVDVLDPGAFESGAILVITQPVTIDGGAGHVASMGATGPTDTIQINLTQPSAGGVVLRNLSLNGFGGLGLNGIHVMSAGNVSLSNVDVSGYSQNCLLVDADANGAQIDVADSTFTNCNIGIANTGTAAVNVGGSTVAFNSFIGVSSTNLDGAMLLFHSNISNNTKNTFILTYSVQVDPIPSLPALPPVSGIGSQPTVLDLSRGQGPVMINCLLATVRNLLGADIQYLGQSANGAAQFTQGGRSFAVYPVQASTFAGQTADIHLTDSNMLNIGTSCGSFNVVPAMWSLADFGAVLNSTGLQATINAQGVITIVVGNTVFVARPDYLVISGAPGTVGTPSLNLGADGLYRFTDSAGNVQLLRPAFLDTAGLAGQAGLLGGSILIQTDGTAVFSTFFGGLQYVLTPDFMLTPAPSANATQFFWQDATDHYFFRSSLLMQAQGLTARQR